MNYKVNITIAVDGADAPDRDYLNAKTEEIVDYLSFEGEMVVGSFEIHEDDSNAEED